MTYRPSRAEVLKVYGKRVLRWRSNSWPYISGDAFADLADVTFNPPKYRGRGPSLKELKQARVLFVNSSDLKEFLDNFGTQIEAKVILSGNSDTEFHESLKIPNSVNSIFLQNSFISDNVKLFTLPIGIENFRWGVNGNPRFITPGPIRGTSAGTLFGPFGNTHNVRNQVRLNFNQESNTWRFVEGYITPKQFNLLAQDFEFIACVRGNGVDTHRLWETLYRARTPIIFKDRWSESLRHLSLPIRSIESWDRSSLHKVTQSPATLFEPRQLPQLWMPWWENFIREKCS